MWGEGRDRKGEKGEGVGRRDRKERDRKEKDR